MADRETGLLFGKQYHTWTHHWQDMPEFTSESAEPYRSLKIHFEKPEDVRKFAKLTGQSITPKTKSFWYPQQESPAMSKMRYVSPENHMPKYPIYIISKGRWEGRHTSKALEKMGVPYHIVVEPQEADEYRKVIEPSKVLELPFSNLGQGSIPARNWVWQHAKDSGADAHWILDDNIRAFFRCNRNLLIPVHDGTTFYAAERFVDRYENVPMSGMQYYMFLPRRAKKPPYNPNTRVYSCILLKHNQIDGILEERWRGRYNEDTDLSLRILKSGQCTVLFNAFICDKLTTMTCKGGNTEDLYTGVDEGRLKMAQSLVDQHPDVTRVGERWDRAQHVVDYSSFKQPLKFKPGCKPDPEAGDNELGMIFQDQLEDGSWETRQ